MVSQKESEKQKENSDQGFYESLLNGVKKQKAGSDIPGTGENGSGNGEKGGLGAS